MHTVPPLKPEHCGLCGPQVAKLKAGDHSFDVKYRTPAAGIVNGGGDWTTRALNVAVISCD